MCKFLSGITLENGDVLISKNTDSHHEILSEFKIPDKEIPPNFCAWEFTPPIENKRYNYATDLDKWNLNIDEQFPKPEWWNVGIEKLTINECKKLANEFLLRTDIEKIESGRWIIRGGTVKSIRGGTVKSILGGTVEYILGGTVESIDGGTVKSIRGGTVEYIRGGTVEYIIGGTVEYIDGGTVESIGGGTVEYIIGGTVESIDGGTVESINGGTVKSIRGGTVKSIRGGTVESIIGGTVTIFIKHNFKPTGNAIIIDKSGKNVIFITAKNLFEDK